MADRDTSWDRSLRSFLRTPKGLMTLVLLVLIAAAFFVVDGRRILPLIVAGAGVAAAIDVAVLRWRGGRWVFPSGAVLTGLFVAMVLSSHESWRVAAATSALAVLSKYVFRGRTANVFNPAAAALVATFYLLGSGQDWWGALADAGPAGLALLFASGAFITSRVNKLPLVLSFLGTYFLLFTAVAFFGDPRMVAEIFRSPDVNAALFFAFFILTDPPTSPVKYREQIACGVLVAVASFAVFEWLGAVHYLLSGVLVGNVWEAWRRQRADRIRATARARMNGRAGAGAPA